MRILILFLTSIYALKILSHSDKLASTDSLEHSHWISDNEKFDTISDVDRQNTYAIKLQAQQFCSDLYEEALLNGVDTVSKRTYTIKESSKDTPTLITINDCTQFNSFDTQDSRSDRKPLLDFSENKQFTTIDLTKAEESTILKKPLKNGFALMFSCNIPDLSICAMAKRAYTSATQRISNVIKLKYQVILNAKYISFCTAKKDCSGQILGQASATSFWKLAADPSEPRIDPFYWYPQALAKQLAPSNQEKAWAKSDIDAEFNHDRGSDPTLPKGMPRFWFRESKKVIQAAQYDFEYVVLHEILHGMGFSTSWNTYIPGKKSQPLLPLITPWFNFDKQPNGQVVANGCNPLTIFDKFVYSRVDNRSLTTSYLLMTGDGLIIPNQSFKTWAKKFDQSAALTEAKRIYKLATTKNAIEFRLKNGNAVVLHTGYPVFKPGSSLTHVDQSFYTKTSSFLMRPEASEGMTLAGLGATPIDSKLVDIFERIGYEVIRS